VHHGAALGGSVTALVRPESFRSHALRRVVRVELPGADARPDFLCEDGRVRESSGANTDVADCSAGAGAVWSSQGLALSLPATAASLRYARVDLPPAATWRSASCVRADGRRVTPENVWITGARAGRPAAVHLFDVASVVGDYAFTFSEGSSGNRAPRVLPMGDVTASAGSQVEVAVAGDDPDGTLPALEAAPLPAGARFMLTQPGRGSFDWTPTTAQVGVYRVRVTASDGEASGYENLLVEVVRSLADPAGTLLLFR
jgi:hypothetical protein